MAPGRRYHDAASLTVAIPSGLPPHMHGRVRELLSIEVPEDQRRQGLATKLLRDVVMEADREGKTLLLWVKPYGTMGERDLIAWYRRFGFEVIQPQPVLMARAARTNQVVALSEQALEQLRRKSLSNSIAIASRGIDSRAVH